jgi:nitroreductase
MDSILSCIASRRSVRAYTSQKVGRDDILKLLTAAGWAPSGNNLQPWKFCVVMEDAELKNRLASLTVYQNWVKEAPCLIAVYLDTKMIDDKIANAYMKHVQSIGSAIQNILLAAHELGLGTCWIGEILKSEDKIQELLALPPTLQLMAVISVGYPAKDKLKATRKTVSENILKWL